jgi:hypothetical protein
MLGKHTNAIVLAIFAFWIVGFAYQVGRSSQHQEDRRKIETAYRASAIQSQKHSDAAEAPEVTFLTLRLGEVLLVFATVLLVLVTKALVDGSKESAERQLRAYVHIRNVRISEMNSGNNPKIEVFVRNYGQTPARRITNTYNCREMKQPIEREFALDKLQMVELADLAPRAETRSTTNYPFPRWGPIKPVLLNKTVVFYVWGRVDYYDVFEQHRWTEYRFRLAIGNISGIPDDDNLVIDNRSGNRTT